MSPQDSVLNGPASAAGPEDAAQLVAITRRAVEGDIEATQELLNQLRPQVMRVVVGVLGASHPDVEDAVQQCLIAVLRGLPTFRGECHPAGYASTIAFRTALRLRRRERITSSRREQLAQLAAEEGLAEPPSEYASAEQRRKLLRELLDELPEEQAEAFALRVILGWSLEEVATASAAPINTIRSRVRLAKEALRRRLDATPGLTDELEP